MERASTEPRLSARIVARRAMRYRGGADAVLDRPAYVRAASGVAFVGGRLAVVQDDASFIALVDPATGEADAIALPADAQGRRAFEEARGEKHLKLDLESCMAWAEGEGIRLLALGSGSLPQRERIVSVTWDRDGRTLTDLRVLDAGGLYAALRAAPAFSGSELNIEGAVRRGDALLLFQRGNGAPSAERPAVNAVGELDLAAFDAYLAGTQPPQLVRSRAYDLGSVAGVPYTFTDATLSPAGRVLFLASAEDSSDTVSDGALHGTLLGELLDDGSVRTTVLRDEHGRMSSAKAEGIAIDPSNPSRAYLVVDADTPTLAAELLEVQLDAGGIRAR